jgi:hypothetical protein
MLDLAGHHDPKTGWLIRITEMLIRIRILILLFIKVLQIFEHWYTDPPPPPPRLHCELYLHLQLLF